MVGWADAGSPTCAHKIRWASYLSPTYETSGKGRVDGVVERFAYVGIVGNGTYQRHTAGITRGHAVLDQCRGVDQQTGRYALIQTVPLQIARGMTDLHQLGSNTPVE